MRLLQAMAGAEFGGAEAFFTRLVPALNRAGIEQRVLIRRDAARAAALRAGGIEPVELPFGGRLDWKTRRAFAREIQDFRPQVVLTWMNRATQFCPRGDFVHAARLGGYYKLKYYRRCDHLIGNTQDICDYLTRSGWPAARVHYLPNFVDATRAAPIARAAMDTPDSAKVILALGRLHENKAFDVLLDALAALPEDHILWLAGEGPLRDALWAQAQRLGVAGRVRFLGWRTDGPALFAAADVFVCPSRHEPLGNVVIEGWAQARPVVATRSAGPVSLIEDGLNGLLTPIDEARPLAEAIARVTRDPAFAASLAEAGQRAFEARFTEAAVVAQYVAFLNKVAG